MLSDKQQPTLFYRANANYTIGFGHLYRGLFLKYYWENAGGDFLLITNPLSKDSKERLAITEKEIEEVSDDTDESSVLEKITNQWGKGVWVTDGDDEVFYEEAYQKAVKTFGHVLVTITFRNDKHFYSDILHNQNIRAPELPYSTEDYTKKLLGLNYLILNPAILKAYKSQKTDSKKDALLISFGSADKRQILDKVLDAILSNNYLRTLHLDLVIGNYPANYKAKVAELLSSEGVNFTIHESGQDMGKLMKRAKVAFSSGGLTAWELAVMSVPNFIIPWTEREKLSAKACEDYDSAIVLEPEKRTSTLANTIQYYLNEWKDFKEKSQKLLKMINPYGGELVTQELMKAHESVGQ